MRKILKDKYKNKSEEEFEEKIIKNTKLNLKSYKDFTNNENKNNEILDISMLIFKAERTDTGLTDQPEFEWPCKNELIEIKTSDHFDIFENQIFIEIIKEKVVSCQSYIFGENLEQRLKSYSQSRLNDLSITDLGEEKLLKDTDVETPYNVDEILSTLDQANKIVFCGEPGSGKTSILYSMEYKLLKSFEYSHSYFPVFIDLGKTHIVDMYCLLKFGFSPQEIESKNYKKIVFLLDSFDEAKSQESIISMIHNLSPYGKVVIACRTYVYEALSQPHVVFGKHKQYNLLPLNEIQIQKIINNEDNYNFIKKMFQLGELIKNPLVLSLIIGLIPELKKIQFNKSLSRYEIYRMFFEKLFDEKKYEIEIEYGIRPSVNIKKAFENYMKSEAIISHQVGDFEETNYPDTIFAKKAYLIHQHLTFREYFLVEIFFEEMVSLMSGSCKNITLLSTVILKNEISILNFLSDKIRSDKNFIQIIHKMYQWILRSRWDKSLETSLISGNMLTLLNDLKIPFSNIDFHSIKAKNINFSKSILQNTVLDHAALEDISFEQAFLPNAIFSNAELTNPDFGRYPSIRVEGEIIGFDINLSLKQVLIAIAPPNEKNIIFEIWDIDTHKKVSSIIIQLSCFPIEKLCLSNGGEYITLSSIAFKNKKENTDIKYFMRFNSKNGNDFKNEVFPSEFSLISEDFLYQLNENNHELIIYKFDLYSKSLELIGKVSIVDNLVSCLYETYKNQILIRTESQLLGFNLNTDKTTLLFNLDNLQIRPKEPINIFSYEGSNVLASINGVTFGGNRGTYINFFTANSHEKLDSKLITQSLEFRKGIQQLTATASNVCYASVDNGFYSEEKITYLNYYFLKNSLEEKYSTEINNYLLYYQLHSHQSLLIDIRRNNSIHYNKLGFTGSPAILNSTNSIVAYCFTIEGIVVLDQNFQLYFYILPDQQIKIKYDLSEYIRSNENLNNHMNILMGPNELIVIHNDKFLLILPLLQPEKRVFLDLEYIIRKNFKEEELQYSVNDKLPYLIHQINFMNTENLVICVGVLTDGWCNEYDDSESGFNVNTGVTLKEVLVLWNFVNDTTQLTALGEIEGSDDILSHVSFPASVQNNLLALNYEKNIFFYELSGNNLKKLESDLFTECENLLLINNGKYLVCLNKNDEDDRSIDICRLDINEHFVQVKSILSFKLPYIRSLSNKAGRLSWCIDAQVLQVRIPDNSVFVFHFEIHDENITPTLLSHNYPSLYYSDVRFENTNMPDWCFKLFKKNNALSKTENLLPHSFPIKEPQTTDSNSLFPTDIMLNIIKKLSYSDRLNFSIVSKNCYNLSTDKILNERFGNLLTTAAIEVLKSYVSLYFKQLYINTLCFDKIEANLKIRPSKHLSEVIEIGFFANKNKRDTSSQAEPCWFEMPVKNLQAMIPEFKK